MAYSIVIPSRNIANLTACVGALRAAGETGRVMWVDDYDGPRDLPQRVLGHRCLHVSGEKPFCFARNINIGIRAADGDDVLILNDDAILETVGGFRWMVALMEDPLAAQYGILACSTNVTGYPAQQRRGIIAADGVTVESLIRCVDFAAFVAVLIPRRTIDLVGLLDERFGGPGVYGGEDVDYCLRVQEAGLKVGVSDFCFVDHSKLASTFRPAHPENRAGGDIRESNRIGIKKWGDRWPFRN